MIPGQEIVERIISSDPGVKDATLLSRSATASADSFTSYAWSVLSRPTNLQVLVSGNIESGKEARTWTFLKQDQTVDPKPHDRVTVDGVTYNLRDITNIRWDGYGFDALCVRDAS